MGYDVFISYSHKDKIIADTVVATLEKNGVGCWYAPRDINPSDDWGDAISIAIENCKIFLIIFSGRSNKSRHVLDELILAIDEEVVVLPFRVENLEPNGAMRLHLSSRHWLDAYDPSWEDHIEKLVQTICANLDICVEKEVVEIPADVKRTPKKRKKKKFNKFIYAIIIGAVLFVIGWFLWNNFFREIIQNQDSSFSATETSETKPTVETSKVAPTQTEQYVNNILGEWNEECLIAYSSISSDTFSIWVMQPDGGNQRVLTSDENDDHFPKWSSTGDKIAFYSDPLYQISLMDLDWVDAIQFSIDRLSREEYRYQFEWSPSSDFVIAYVSEEKGNADIILTKYGESGKKTFVDLANDTDPTWSPDGQKIAFVSDLEGNKDIYIADVGSGEITRLTNNYADDIEPSWSPNGNTIAFVSDRDGDYNIFMIEKDGSNLIRVTDIGDNYYPTWSNDGHSFVYYSVRDSEGGYYIYNLDGGESELILASDYSCQPELYDMRLDMSVSFSPDDTEIILNQCGEIVFLSLHGDEVSIIASGYSPVWSPLCKRDE